MMLPPDFGVPLGCPGRLAAGTTSAQLGFGRIYLEFSVVVRVPHPTKLCSLCPVRDWTPQPSDNVLKVRTGDIA